MPAGPARHKLRVMMVDLRIGWVHRIAATLLLWALVQPTPSEAGQCPSRKKKPQLEVIVDLGDVTWNHQLEDAEIKQITNQHRGYVKGPWYRPIGLTTAKLSSNYSTRVSVRRATGGYCAYLTEGRVEVGYSEATIYIARRYAEGTCAYRVIREHELKHLAANRETLAAYKPQIEKALRQLVRAKPGVFVHRKAKAETAYLLTMRERLEPILQQMEAERNRRHAKLDSADSYKREQAKCEKW